MSCIYCKSENEPLYHEGGPVKSMDSYVWVVDDQIEIDLWGSENICLVIAIQYCPMCGQKLKV